ncbi:pseudaminic acid synthase [uncultured Shewanella sp.]|uniref:pseudaminic acid synthase n=1 Tax=Shewanella atlantica TaxID=271099 RepID=UPI002609E8F3|nr:pseudaminic acid synthase [uncultured Shewanella sp.]
MSNVISIEGRAIGAGLPPYIIAELSANHNGNIQVAFDIIAHAKRAGADAVKMQTYRPDTITIDSRSADFQIHGGLWDGKTLYQLYEWAHTPWDWHKPLFDYARQLGITIFSSPFDTTAVDLLEDLNAPAYKIASFEAVDIPLIKYAASTGKPLIISTGMANEEEIGEAIDAARSCGCKDLAILHCVSAYPASADDYNLATLVDMKNRFNLVTGLSDHTLSNVTAIAATSLGASIIEKHVTLDRSGGGPDDSFSLEPDELRQLCHDSKLAWSSLGKVNYSRSASEKANLQFRRSLYVVKPVKAGERITAENVKSIRPGFGLAPKHLESLIGKTFTQDLGEGTALKMEYIAL